MEPKAPAASEQGAAASSIVAASCETVAEDAEGSSGKVDALVGATPAEAAKLDVPVGSSETIGASSDKGVTPVDEACPEAQVESKELMAKTSSKPVATDAECPSGNGATPVEGAESKETMVAASGELAAVEVSTSPTGPGTQKAMETGSQQAMETGTGEAQQVPADSGRGVWFKCGDERPRWHQLSPPRGALSQDSVPSTVVPEVHFRCNGKLEKLDNFLIRRPLDFTCMPINVIKAIFL